MLESLLAVCSDAKLLFILYRVYDCAEDIEEVLQEEEEVLAAATSEAAAVALANSSPTAALALLKNDEAKPMPSHSNTTPSSKKKETNKRPVPLISNLVNVISHFLTEVVPCINASLSLPPFKHSCLSMYSPLHSLIYENLF